MEEKKKERNSDIISMIIWFFLFGHIYSINKHVIFLKKITSTQTN